MRNANVRNGLKERKSLLGKGNEAKKEQITAGGLQKKETCDGAIIPLQSEIAAGHSNTRELTRITLERDKLKKQYESLAKHLEKAQVVVSNLKKKLTTTFQDRATSPRDSEEFERTGRRRLRIRRYH